MRWNNFSIPKLQWLPLFKFGDGYVISFHTLLCMWSLIHVGIKNNPWYQNYMIQWTVAYLASLGHIQLKLTRNKHYWWVSTSNGDTAVLCSVITCCLEHLDTIFIKGIMAVLFQLQSTSTQGDGLNSHIRDPPAWWIWNIWSEDMFTMFLIYALFTCSANT